MMESTVSLIWIHDEFWDDHFVAAVLPGSIDYEDPAPFQKIIDDYFEVGVPGGIVGPCEIEKNKNGKWVYYYENGQDYEIMVDIEVVELGKTLDKFMPED